MKHIEFELREDNFLVRDHRIYDIHILPGVCLIDAVLRSCGSLNYPLSLKQVLFKQPIALAKGEAIRVRVTRLSEESGDRIIVSSVNSDGVWIDHLSAIMEVKSSADTSFAGKQVGESGRLINMNDLYQLAETWGIKHGEFMRAVGEVRLAKQRVSMSLHTNELASQYADKFILHPTLLDAATFSALALRYDEFSTSTNNKAYIPIYIEEVIIYKKIQRSCVVEATSIASDHHEINKLDITIMSEDDSPLVVMKNFQNKRINQQDAIYQLLNREPPSISKNNPVSRQTERRDLLPYLRSLFAGLLSKPVTEQDMSVSFFHLGLDSIGLVSAVENIEAEFELDLYPTLLFEKNTLQKLHDYLMALIPETVTTRYEIPDQITNNEKVYLESVWVESKFPANNQNKNYAALILSSRLNQHEINMPNTLVLNQRDITQQTLSLWLNQQQSHDLRIINLLQTESMQEIDDQIDSGMITLIRCLPTLLTETNHSITIINCYTQGSAHHALGEMAGALATSLKHETKHVQVKSLAIPEAAQIDKPLLMRLIHAADLQQHSIAIQQASSVYLVKKLQRITELPPTPVRTLREGGFYVITGGFGEIARQLALYLVTHYQANVLLLGRRHPNAEQTQWLSAHSAHLRYQQLDVGIAEEITRLIESFVSAKTKIDGIFHTAGLLADRLSRDITTDDFYKVIHAKIRGTYLLKKITENLSVDFIMLFSSLSSVLGNAGQSLYAAANSFMDVFSRQQTNNHCKWISVNWPLWKTGGMKLSSHQQAKLAKQSGLQPLESAEAFQIIEDALAMGKPQIIPLPQQALHLVEHELQREMHSDDIAIIGVAGQYPAAENLDIFWDNLLQGKDCISSLHTRFPDAPYGWSGLLHSIRQFDPAFFHISPADAKCMDPQERLFLQTAWSCLENAGYAANHTREDEHIGVYVGAMFGLYQLYGINLQDKSKYPDSSFASLANRVSYHFNLTGPSFTLDSMCSSSLTALHLACQQLRHHEISMALVGGVNIISHPAKYQTLLNKRFLSSKGRCESFGKDGDGYVPGEGVGAVLLKPLAKAISDKDYIYGVIKASAINHGGQSAGYTVPSATAQAQVISSAMKQAGVTSNDISYIEAHGTGTALGDPIELSALQECYGKSGPDVYLGSVKSNIGHLESAAGMAAITKVLLQYQHHTLVPTLHAGEYNPAFDFSTSRFKLIDQAVVLDSKALTAISSFGAGGSNAHVIVSSAPVINLEPDPAGTRYLFCVSAKTAASLKRSLNRLGQWLQTYKEKYRLSDISYTLNHTREHFQSRWAVTASSFDELIDKVQGKLYQEPEDAMSLYLAGELPPALRNDRVQHHHRVPLPGYAFAEEEYWITEAENNSQYISLRLQPMSMSKTALPADNIVMLNDEDMEGMSIHPYTHYIYRIATNPAHTEAFHTALDLIERFAERLSNESRRAALGNFILLTESGQQSCAFALLSAINSLRSKYPAIQFQIIEKDNETDIELITNNLAEMMKHRIICYRQNRAYLPDFNEIKPNSNLTWIKAEGVYLVIGGLGDIGFQLCLALAKQHKANFILAGRRSEHHPDVINKLAELNRLQSTVTYVQCDMTDESAVQRLKERVLDRYQVCNGILYLAGSMPTAIDPAAHAMLDMQSSKIRGTKLIDRAFADVCLDWFIIFGSLSSIAGLPGALSYAIENGFLNDFILQRENKYKQQGRQGRTYLLNWPWWEGTSQAGISPEQLKTWMGWSYAKQGLLPLNTEQGLACLCDIIENNESGIYFPFNGEAAAYLAYLQSQVINEVKMPVVRKPALKRESIHDSVITAIQETIELNAQQISPQATWLEMGFDSISLADFAAKLAAIYSVEILPTHLFTHSTVDKLISYLSQNQIEPDQTSEVHQLSSPMNTILDEIVIVGVAAKLPQTDHHEDWWSDLLEGRSQYSSVPQDRWFTERQNICAGFIKDMDCFDPNFFGILPVDAKFMDPQQRWLLQSMWNAMEDAGQDPERLRGHAIGVFVGAQFSDYQNLLLREGSQQISSVIGNAHTFLANRVSSFMDFTGPSEMLDTACSSSLVALHHACQAIMNNECESALVGGVSLFLDPDTLTLAEKMGIISPDNVCRPFDQSANGYVKGEGVISLWLMKRSSALANRYPVYGVIKGSGVNHNGKSTSLTSPNVAAQKRLLLNVYRQANIPMQSISYWEAHGTGTSLGDPMEIQALLEADRNDRDTTQENCVTCAIGSGKANIGHLEPASGLAGIVKVLLMFKHKMIPKQSNFIKQNDYINLRDSRFYIPVINSAWDPTNEHLQPILRRAGVSSFGFGGTNAHVILEEFIAPITNASDKQEPPFHLITLSAKSLYSLRQKCRNLLAYFAIQRPALADLAYTLARGRSHFQYRCAWVVNSIEELIDHMEALLANESELLPNSTSGAISNSTHVLEQLQLFLVHRLQNECLSTESYHDMLSTFAALYCQGVELDFAQLYDDSAYQRLSLPVYPFEKQSFWYKYKIVIEDKKPLQGFYRPSWIACDYKSKGKAIDSIIYLVHSDATYSTAQLMHQLIPSHSVVIPQDDLNYVELNDRCQVWYLAETANQSSHVEKLLVLLQTLANTVPADLPLTLKVITTDVYQINELNASNHSGAGIHGLCLTAAKEFPHWCVGAIDVVEHSLSDTRLLSCIYHFDCRLHTSYAIRDLTVYRQTLEAVNNTHSAVDGAFVKNGVYLLLGGTGRIGMALCEYLLEKYAATVILIGSSVLSDIKLRQLAKLKRLPGHVIYRQVDITNKTVFKLAVQELVKIYKHFAAIIHCAMIYDETPLTTLTANSLRQAIAVKLSPLEILDSLKEDKITDQLIVFSSAQSFHANSHRGAYTAASQMQDRYCHHLSASIPVKLINWGFWELPDAASNSKLINYGVTPINNKSGMNALEAILIQPEMQWVYMQVSAEIEILMHIDRNKQVVDKNPVTIQLAGLAQIDMVLIKWLYYSLQKKGILNQTGKRYTLAELGNQFYADQKGLRLLDTILRILANGGYLKVQGDFYSLDRTFIVAQPPVSDQSIQKEKLDLISRYPTLEAHINLAYLCIQNLVAILTRERLAADVIFPAGSSELVAPIYKSNPLSQYFNELVGETVHSYLMTLPPRPLRILEVGAGTGATSVSILNRLKNFNNQDIEYYVTDISESLLAFSRQSLDAPNGIKLRYSLLDININPILQGYVADYFDVIVASNVIHAAKDVAASLNFIKNLLKKNGAIVLNECVTHSHFLSLTFGLLDGWWQYQDTALRINGPLLSAEKWHDLLKTCGYNVKLISEPLCEDQKVMMAISDGVVTHDDNRVAVVKHPEKVKLQVPVNEKHASILNFIADCLELERSKLEPETKLLALGIDSISSLTLVNALNKRYNCQLTITNIIQSDTIGALASQINTIQITEDAYS